MQEDIGEDILKMYSPYIDSKAVWKKTKLLQHTFHLPQHYEPIQLRVGGGAYGAVVFAKDLRKSQDNPDFLVAIKKMTNVFEHKIYARRILRELRMLRLFKHPNIIKLFEIVLPPSRSEFKDIYAVFEAMDSDLIPMIRASGQLQDDQRKFFIYQILLALKFIHSAHVAHRDLKPANILINVNCDLKIADFGLSRLLQGSQNISFTDYVVARWYRAPELILENTAYSSVVDMWSLGCIMVELLTHKPFLKTNGDTKEHLSLISQEVGLPHQEQIEKQSQRIKNSLMQIKKKGKKATIFQKLQGKTSAQQIQLIRKMLSFLPEHRITAEEALQDPFFADLREEEIQIMAEKVPMNQFEFQDHNLNTQQIKDLLYEEILLYHFQQFRNQYMEKIKNKESVIVHILKSSNAGKYNPNTDYDNSDNEPTL